MENYDNSITNICYIKIKEMVYTHELQPGEKINKRIIAEKLGFSSTPITLALKKLYGEGFIEYINRKGFFVKVFSDKEIVEFFEVRAGLESLAVKLFIQENNEEHFKYIVTYWDDYKDKELSPDEYVMLDNKFHEKIVEFSNNSILIDIWSKIGCNIKSNQRGLQNSLSISKSDHHEMISAIKDKDADKAQTIMFNHFMKAVDYFKTNRD